MALSRWRPLVARLSSRGNVGAGIVRGFRAGPCGGRGKSAPPRRVRDVRDSKRISNPWWASHGLRPAQSRAISNVARLCVDRGRILPWFGAAEAGRRSHALTHHMHGIRCQRQMTTTKAID
jgi:hypothetical protein